MATRNRRARAVATSSWLALGVALAWGQVALAQQASSGSTGDSTVSEVVVTGTRASLQSAIDRKRRAATTVDSIVAEDVGSFPDKNIAESLQRVTGVQLGRSGEGEGTDVFIRGVDADLNRVEINGMTALNNSGTATTGRGASLIEMAPELVASIDVFKGFTADMTEGGVGGTVSITTRKPLDLRRPLLSATASAQYLDITKSTKFRGNITAGNRFLDDRFGVILNVTYSDVDTRGDYLRDTEWAFLPTTFNTAAQNLAINPATGTATQPFAVGAQNASGDLDNSPDKSYINPAYADITTKAGCPQITASSTAAQRDAASACLQQWSDYVPGNTRYGSWKRNEKRLSGQITLEYRISDNLRGWVDYQTNDRQQTLQDFNFSAPIGQGPAYHRLNAITYDRNGQPILGRDAAGNPIANTTPFGYTARPVVVDEEHNLVDYYMAPYAPTGAQGSAANINLQQRDFSFQYHSDYISGGLNWRSDAWRVDLMVATTKAHNEDETNQQGLNASVPNLHVTISPTSGAPTFEFPAGYDVLDLATYSKPALGRTGNALAVSGANYQYRPAETESTEDMVKFDADWLVDSPFINKVEFGYQYRKSGFLRFQGGGYLTGDLINSPVLVQGANVNYNINYDPNLAASTNPVYTQGALPTYNVSYNAADFAKFVQATARVTPFTFFDSPNYDPGIEPLRQWVTPYFPAVYDYNASAGPRAIDLSLFNHDNVRDAPTYQNRAGCVATGAVVPTTVAGSCYIATGDRLPQIPSQDADETVTAAYGQVTFGGELYGLPISGNAGVRIVKNEVEATGSVVERVTRLTGTDPTNPNASSTVDRSRQIRTLSADYTEALPTFNLSVNFTDRLIGRFGYAKVMARPRVGDLGPGITCTFDETPQGLSDDQNDVCTAGNPDLEPYRADQFDLNIGYYHDRDTLISAGIFFKDINSFILPASSRDNVDLFGDGRLFRVTQVQNGQGAKVQGLELSAQTAFSFLPAPFDGFGGIVNYTYTKGSDTGLFNQITGEELPLTGLSKESYNVILYYEKGPINARLAYNGRTPWLQTTAERSGNPRFRDGSSYLDGKFTYSFNEHFSAFVEAQNLTGEVERSHSGGIRLTEVSWAGKRYFAGFTYRY